MKANIYKKIWKKELNLKKKSEMPFYLLFLVIYKNHCHKTNPLHRTDLNHVAYFQLF